MARSPGERSPRRVQRFVPFHAVDSAAAADPAAIGTSGHAAQIADLLAAIDEGREPSVTGQDGRDALELASAVYESAREGRTVVLAAASGGAEAAAG